MKESFQCQKRHVKNHPKHYLVSVGESKDKLHTSTQSKAIKLETYKKKYKPQETVEPRTAGKKPA